MLISNVVISSELGSSVVKATGLYRGKTVSATATCHENDEWNWDIGVALAMSRLAQKVGEMELERIEARKDEILDEIADLEIELDGLDELWDDTENALDEVNETIDEIIETTQYE